MPLVIGTQIDTSRIPIKGLIPEQSATALGTPVEGLIWHDTVNKVVKIYLNSTWMTLGAAGQAVADGDKGDITVASGGTVWTLDTGAVTTAKIAPSAVTTNEILDGTIVPNDISSNSKDGPIGTYSMRTLGFGGNQALAGTTRLDQLAAPTAAVNLNSQKITALLDPTAAQEAATKNYVDLVAQGLDAKPSVRCATTASISAGAAPAGAQTIDGVVVATADRVLVKDQSTPANNGIWSANTGGSWNRITEMDSWAEVPGAYVFVEEGTVNADTGWVCTANQGGTLNTTAITWTQFSGAGSIAVGTGLTKAGNTISLDTAYTDTAYVNTAGDTMSGILSVNGAANYFKRPDTVQNLETRTYGDRYGFYNSTGTMYGCLSEDPANSLMTLQRTLGTLAIIAPKITISQNPATSTEVANKAYVDTAVTGLAKKYAALVPAITAGVPLTITHSLNTQDVVVSFRDASTNAEVLIAWTANGVNTIQANADIAFGANALRVTVIG